MVKLGVKKVKRLTIWDGLSTSQQISFSKRIKERKISRVAVSESLLVFEKNKKSISPGRLQYLPLLYTCLKSPEMGGGGKVKNQDYQI